MSAFLQKLPNSVSLCALDIPVRGRALLSSSDDQRNGGGERVRSQVEGMASRSRGAQNGLEGEIVFRRAY